MNLLERSILGMDKTASAMPMDWEKVMPFLKGVPESVGDSILSAAKHMYGNKGFLYALGALGAGSALMYGLNSTKKYNDLKANSVSKHDMEIALERARVEANRKAAMKWGLAGLAAGSLVGGYGGYRLGSRNNSKPAAKKPDTTEPYEIDMSDYYPEYYSSYSGRY
jgi:hypothetical protein